MAEQDFRFQIRHGNGNPPAGNLKQYELGYDYTNKKFYIGTGTSTTSPSEEINYLHLTGGTLSGKLRIETKTSDAKAYCQVKDADTDAYIQMGIQRDKEKIGICTNGYYDTSKNFISTSTNWMIYRDTDGSNIFKGKADSAIKLLTSRNINGTAFDGTAAITTANWGTARTISIANAAGTTGTSINGSEDKSLVIPKTLTGFTSITSTTFVGALSGNATSATKATQDGSGNTITSTYFKVSGGTLTGNIAVEKSEKGGRIGITDNVGIDCRIAITASSGSGNHGLWSSGYSSDGTSSSYTKSSQWIIYRNSTGEAVIPIDTRLNGSIYLDGSCYGSSVPTTTGRLYFKTS